MGIAGLRRALSHAKPGRGDRQHLDGAGITSAKLLTRVAGSAQVHALQNAAPGRFTWFCSADPSSPEGVESLTVKSGARGFGEMKYHLGTDGPEFRRV